MRSEASSRTRVRVALALFAFVLTTLATGHAQETQNDCGVMKDASNDRTQPTVLRANYDATTTPDDDNPDAIVRRPDQCRGVIDPQPAPQFPVDPADYYGVYLRAGERAVMTAVVETGGPFTLVVYDPSGQRFPLSTEVFPLPDPGNPFAYGGRLNDIVPVVSNLCGDFDFIPDTCSMSAPKAGMWAIGITTKSGTAGAYDLTIVTTGRQDDCALSQISAFNRGDASNVHPFIVDDPAKVATGATPLGVTYKPGTGSGDIPPRTTEATAGAFCHGTLGPEDHSDAYSFFVHAGQTITGDVSSDGSVTATLFDPAGNPLISPASTVFPTPSATSSLLRLPAPFGTGPLAKSGLYTLVIQQGYLIVNCAICGTEPSTGVRMSSPEGYDFFVRVSQAECASDPPVDAGNTIGSAMNLAVAAIPWPPPPSPPTTARCLGTLDFTNQGDGEDWFKFPAGPGITLQFRLEVPAGADFDLFLYAGPDTSPTLVAQSTRGPGLLEEITYQVPTTTPRLSPWFVRVRGTSGSGGYALFSNASGSDCAVDNGDVGATRADALARTVEEAPPPCFASFTSLSDQDVYKFHVSIPGTILSILVPFHVNATISDPFDTVVCTSAGGPCVGGPDPIDPNSHPLTIKARATGDWLLRVTPTKIGDYKFTASATLLPDCDIPDPGVDPGGDAGDTFAEASRLDFAAAGSQFTFGVGCLGHLVHPQLDREDWYQVTAPGQVTVAVYPDDTFAFLVPDADIDLCVYAPNDPVNPKACSRNGPGEMELLSFFATGATPANPWRIRIFFIANAVIGFGGAPGDNPYQLRVQTQTL